MPSRLEDEQVDLLRDLAEVARALPRERRVFNLLSRGLSSNPFEEITWEGGRREALGRDIHDLVRAGLLRRVGPHRTSGAMQFTVTPEAYDHLTLHDAEAPLARVEEHIVEHYIDGEAFKQRNPVAYQRWAESAALLWGRDAESELTTIGHKTREAVQEFATTLLERHEAPDASPDPAHTANRLRAVINANRDRLGEARRDLLDALIVYWGEVNDLLQRQEHGGQKEGEPLAWEDGRRAVFQTAVVMYEIDRTL
jgi:hypothetical protein